MALAARLDTKKKSKRDQLFDTYEKFNIDNSIADKNIDNFIDFIKKEKINLNINELIIRDIFSNLNNPEKKEEIINTIDMLDTKEPEVKEEAIQAITEKTEEHKIEMTEATDKANEEKTMKMKELTNLLQDKPENAEKNAEKIVNQAKSRLKDTIDRYVTKIKELKNTTGSEREKLTKDLETARAELKKEKEGYEKAKKDFFSKMGNDFKNFSKEELKKLPIRFLRYKQREGLFNKPVGFNSISSIRRRKTINTLAKKMNAIGKDHTKGINFVMGFHKDRLGRYTDIRISSILHKVGANMGLQMNPQQFHEQFNKGRKAITDILDNENAGELSPDEKIKVDAIKNRINYYGATYAKERANARVGPFIDAEKNATKENKIIQMKPPIDEANAA